MRRENSRENRSKLVPFYSTLLFSLLYYSLQSFKIEKNIVGRFILNISRQRSRERKVRRGGKSMY